MRTRSAVSVAGSGLLLAVVGLLLAAAPAGAANAYTVRGEEEDYDCGSLSTAIYGAPSGEQNDLTMYSEPGYSVDNPIGPGEAGPCGNTPTFVDLGASINARSGCENRLLIESGEPIHSNNIARCDPTRSSLRGVEIHLRNLDDSFRIAPNVTVAMTPVLGAYVFSPDIRVYGGSGNDTIKTANGDRNPDEVFCGPGNADVAVIDLGDSASAACETVIVRG